LLPHILVRAPRLAQILLLCVWTVALEGCLGAGVHVAYRQTGEISDPQIRSRTDRSMSRSIDYFQSKLPPADRMEVDGTRSVFHYDRLKLILGGPTLVLSPGVPLGLILPVPLGWAKASLTFENGQLVSVRATTEQQAGLRFLYSVRDRAADILAGTRPQISVIGDYEIHPGSR
jgi:hypothetical protein